MPAMLRSSALLLGVLLSPSCASFRAAWVDAWNTELAGEPAPVLEGQAWIDEHGIDDTPRRFGPEPLTVIAFLRPT